MRMLVIQTPTALSLVRPRPAVEHKNRTLAPE
jgi:hypothetical protein